MSLLDNLTKQELELVCEALRMAASRHESASRFLIGRPRGTSRLHDDKAAAMRALILRIQKKIMSHGTASSKSVL